MVIPPSALIDAWNRAASELGIVVVAPFTPEGDPSGSCFAAKVESFGQPAGTVVDWIGSDNTHEWARRQGLYVSTINAAAYSKFDPVLFRDTLDDWGWTDTSDAPAWYTGRPWS